MCARILLLLFAISATLHAQINPTWTTNHKPFRIAGNLYYVGSEDLAAYLITTSQGNILINANLATSPAQIRENIKALGFRFSDTKILLNSQAHYDHMAGAAEIKRLTHAKVEVMRADVPAVESGGRKDFFFYQDSTAWFEPVKVDHVLKDGEEVKLGSTILTAHWTPGHSAGDTTWTMQVTGEDGRTYNVVIHGGATMNPGNNLIDDPRYPNEASDFIHTFQISRALPCDIFLGAHGVYFDFQKKYERLVAGDKNAFVDPKGYQAYLENRERAFYVERAKQKATKK